MNNENRNVKFQMMVLIVSSKLTDKVVHLCQKERVPVQYQFRAGGTATSDIMAMLGLGNVGKTVFLGMMPEFYTAEVMEKLKKALKLRTSNSGIVFSIPLSGGSNKLLKILEALHQKKEPFAADSEERDVKKVADSEYALILVIVDQGYCEDVMNAARPVGAQGGTVINSRRLVSEESMKWWGVSIHQEREIIAIVAEQKNKIKIMKAISEKCGAHSEAKGILLSMPVEHVIGLD